MSLIIGLFVFLEKFQKDQVYFEFVSWHNKMIDQGEFAFIQLIMLKQ